MWFDHLVADPLGDIDAHVVGLRFHQGLPAHEDDFWEVDTGNGLYCPPSDMPADSISGIADYTSVDSLVGKATLINHVDTFHPYFHVSRRLNSYVPDVVRQFGPPLTYGTADEHQSEETDQ
ncbi:hypothetical protein D9M71_778410 [compost metagenome]